MVANILLKDNLMCAQQAFLYSVRCYDCDVSVYVSLQLTVSKSGITASVGLVILTAENCNDNSVSSSQLPHEVHEMYTVFGLVTIKNNDSAILCCFSLQKQ